MIEVNNKARPHVAAPVKTYLETVKHSSGKFYPVLPHPPYSPDIAPYSDIHLFRLMTRMACLSSTSHHMKIHQKLGRFVDSLKR